eukprot:gnl/MRDRNA2_/MRDRNA2_87808_c0_seq1.p1 gnl/MRDRNA2_/MRDRNA2_87808_c0~~gnl/MRDRNA2_/MRDRNA2_87808_c0_seq1.p1  ORF type:complete len:370 (+),score=44.10 gnl/MRDRNA2_/MRDRNA2_87808_c0_seq1:79-1188(+)
MIDLDPGVILRALLYVDSLAAFRMRRCCRLLEDLLSANRGLKIWSDLLQDASGSHAIDSGMWLHALMTEDVLSLYARLCSTTELATNIRFESVALVEALLKASCIIQGISDKEEVFDENFPGRDRELFLGGRGNSYLGKGQRFFGSWVFNKEKIVTMLRGQENGPVCSSLVKFRWIQGIEGEPLYFQPGNFEFGVLLMLNRAPPPNSDRFIISWQPHCTTPGLLGEELDCFEIHLHGHVAEPCILPLGYEGAISTMASPHANVPFGLTLGSADITELVEHDCLLCVLTIRFYSMGDEALVTSCENFRQQTRTGSRWSESSRKLSREFGLAQRSPEMSTATDPEEVDVLRSSLEVTPSHWELEDTNPYFG